MSDKFDSYAKEVERALRAEEILVEGDYSDDRMNAKIRNAQTQKIPYMLVVGEKEMNEKAVSIRVRTGEQMNGMPLDEAIALIKDKIEKKELP